MCNDDGDIKYLVELGLDITEKKKVEIELKEKNDKLENLVKSSSEFIWQVDKNGVYTYVSEGAEKLVGYRLAEIIGKTPFDFMSSSEAERVSEIFTDIVKKTDRIHSLQDVMIHKNGKRVFFETDGIPLFNEHNEFTGYFGICRDITKRKENEKKILDAKKNLECERNVLQQIMNGAKNIHLVFLDTDFNFIRVNETYAQTCGYQPEEMIGKNHFELYPDDENKEIFTRVRDSGIPYTAQDKPFNFPDQPDRGVTYWDWTLNPIKNSKGSVEGLVFSLVETTERKKIEFQIQEKEKKFRSLVEQSSDMLFLHDTEGCILEVNNAAENHTGYSRDELLGMTVFDIDPDSKNRDDQKRYWRKLKQDDPAMVFDARHKSKDGKIYDAEISVAKIILNDEEYILGLARNITERKKAEEKIIESERKYRELFNNALVGIAVHKPDGRIISMNSTAERIFGFNEEELEQKNIDFWNGKLLNADGERMDQYSFPLNIASRTKKPSEGQEIGLSMDEDPNKIRWFLNSVRPILKPNGEIDNIVASFVEITNRKHAEEALRKSEERNRLLFNTVPSGVGITHLDGSVIKVNTVLCDMLGFSKDEFSKINIKNLYVDDNEREEIIHEIKKNGSIQNFQVRFYRKDGSIGDFLLNSEVVEYGEEKVLLSSARDISFLKKTQLELEKTHKELVELNKTLETKVDEQTKEVKTLLHQKDEFINQLGHDLKNPLGPFVQLLPVLKRHVTDERDQQIISVLERNTGYMRNLVKKTIDLAKLNSSKTTFSFKSVRLSDLVEEIIEVNSSLIKDNSFSIDVDIPSDYMAYADGVHIQEVFSNLINNAVKYSEKARWIGIRAVDQDDRILISVRDKGIGISEEQLPFIFDEYYKADPARHDFDSSGLGLPICKRIIEKHGGRIWAESEGLDRGSTFYFTLPKSNN